MFNKFSICAVILTLCASIGFAQTTSSSDYHKFEVYGGYSNNQVDVGEGDFGSNNSLFDDRQTHHGFEAAGVYNVTRYVGIKGDFSAHFKDYNFTVPATGTTPSQNFKVESSLYQFMGGVQIKDNAKEGSRFRPFGHALAGVAHGRGKIDNAFFNSTFCTNIGTVCTQANGLSDSETGFAAAIGGGIDIKATKRLSIRAIQLDYNPTRLGNETQHNFRIGVGLVFH